MDETFHITATEGIHARPAALLVNAATQFTLEIDLYYQGQEANLKSLLSVMTLDAKESLLQLEKVVIVQGVGEICEK